MKIKKFDISIIGGGPAGSAAALFLSKRGYSIAIIEKKLFPREVLCGEFISKEVIDFFKAQSLFEEFLRLGPNPIMSFRFSSENEKVLFAPFRFPAYGIKRSLLDNFLLSKAVEKGVEIFQPAEVTGMVQHFDSYILNIKSKNQELFSVSSKIIIAAYGRQNILDKYSGRDFYRAKTKFNGVKFHIDKAQFYNFNTEEIQIFCGRGIYCGLNAVDNNTVTLCFLEKRDSIQYSPKEFLLQLSRENMKFKALLNKDFFNSLDKIPIYGTGNIYFGKRDIVNGGIFYVGDAAGIIAPLVGDGIGMAVQSASLLSDILSRNNLDHERAGIEYKKEWRKMFLNRITLAGIVQKSVLNNYIRNPGIELIAQFPRALSTIIKYTRG